MDDAVDSSHDTHHPSPPTETGAPSDPHEHPRATRRRRGIRRANIQIPKLKDVFGGLDHAHLGTAASTESNFRRMLNFYHRFCEETGHPFVSQGVGMDLYTPIALQGMNPSNYNKGRINQFADWLQLQEDFNGISHASSAVTMFNSYLKGEWYVKMKNFAPDHAGRPHQNQLNVGTCTNLGLLKKKTRGETADRAMKERVDLASKVARRIDDGQLRQMIFHAFDPPFGGFVFRKKDPRGSIVFAASFNAQMQDVRRAEQHVCQMLVHRYVLPVKRIGPPPGTDCTAVMSNKCKVNKDGRIENHGYAPHNDPTKCQSSWHGCLSAWNHVVEHLPLPKDIMDYDTLYQYPTYGSKHSLMDPISKDSYRELWRGHYLDAGVQLPKITSQTRTQALMEMDDDGISGGVMSRMSGHVGNGTAEQSKAQLKNYLTNVSIAGLVSRAGGKWQNPGSHAPHWCRI